MKIGLVDCIQVQMMTIGDTVYRISSWCAKNTDLS